MAVDGNGRARGQRWPAQAGVNGGVQERGRDAGWQLFSTGHLRLLRAPMGSGMGFTVRRRIGNGRETASASGLAVCVGGGGWVSMATGADG